MSKVLNKKVNDIVLEKCACDEISVLSPGYIICPNGDFIKINDELEHKFTLSKFINTLLKEDKPILYDTYDAIIFLQKSGYCFYSGIRTEYIRNKLQNIENGLTAMFFPEEMSILSEKQKEACLSLIQSNQSIFASREKVFIQYCCGSNDSLTKEEVLENLNGVKKYNRR